ncbi:hypothetical protein GUITHDRAFT_107978 [Guillardia theta CCMP2712]|uniref:Uncharacterized protein n=1 Tax=Guillardia theta (strain CCMP2712) TaxID=905079 RepID=L1JE39_GUITC|nr:hypothetical protein GUITHDRAFT_107978 [Guillardia theta CCMP2712]EKX46370.1 hypothetical protein GUITHDRAFT_107978 [Guillardia theta CCMP2712]|eukprot:XP_005833350.1 hypothetical protein GUITHDRAFT_107978 [Guillardia theta CCMP2712]
MDEALGHIESNTRFSDMKLFDGVSSGCTIETSNESTSADAEVGSISSGDEIAHQGHDAVGVGGKATISGEEAREIFSRKPVDTGLTTRASIILSKSFHISPKAVRDIWNKRTWVRETLSLWTPEELHRYAQSKRCPIAEDGICPFGELCNCRKRPGRPVGSKDSKPRKRRMHSSS